MDGTRIEIRVEDLEDLEHQMPELQRELESVLEDGPCTITVTQDAPEGDDE